MVNLSAGVETNENWCSFDPGTLISLLKLQSLAGAATLLVTATFLAAPLKPAFPLAGPLAAGPLAGVLAGVLAGAAFLGAAGL